VLTFSFLDGCISRSVTCVGLVLFDTCSARIKADIALHGNPISELRDVTCHMGSHSVNCHPIQVNAPRLTPTTQAGTRFTYLGGMEGWVDLVDLITPRPGVEPATFRSRVRLRTAAPPTQPSWLPVDRSRIKSLYAPEVPHYGTFRPTSASTERYLASRYPRPGERDKLSEVGGFVPSSSSSSSSYHCSSLPTHSLDRVRSLRRQLLGIFCWIRIPMVLSK